MHLCSQSGGGYPGQHRVHAHVVRAVAEATRVDATRTTEADLRQTTTFDLCHAAGATPCTWHAETRFAFFPRAALSLRSRKYAVYDISFHVWRSSTCSRDETKIS